MGAGMALLRLISFLVHLIDDKHHSLNVDCIGEATSGPEEQELPAADAADAEAQQKKKDAAEEKKKADAKQLQLMGLNTAAAIGIHNFPEGLCVALPIFYATGSRIKGFLWALLS